MKNSLSRSIAAKWGLALRLEQTRKSLLWGDFVLFSATLLMDWVENNEHDDEIRQLLLRRKGWRIDRRTILSVESLHLPTNAVGNSLCYGNRWWLVQQLWKKRALWVASNLRLYTPTPSTEKTVSLQLVQMYPPANASSKGWAFVKLILCAATLEKYLT